MSKTNSKHFHKNFVPENRFKEALGRFVFWLLGGWKLVGEIPKINKCVIIVAHHTSNWDFIVGVATKLILRLKIRFFAKHSLFAPPLGWLMKGLGGISIKRDKSINRVEQQAEAIRDADNFVLVIAPEGTRSKVDRWKTGFYHIARKADVPIVPCSFDFKNRQVIFGEPMMMSGDQEKDFRDMHEFFLPYTPKHPELGCNGPFEKGDVKP
ncbi:acyltransferase [Endozoicomonas sp. OPT23]|uniref:lysophospholipid acyltransferase family protein n=1 Tax=Endozoicomonas sp. OPT23 TaxID=2072845 RepID=UPI00129AB41E|nr:lysophospholipid acyltransferase family protein [Endozoicomonas sp. OPT23]MRI33021.1 acyltransferase [Endozoicomonas sp. OPT23]